MSKTQRIFDQPCYLWVTELALSSTAVKVSLKFDTPVAVVFDLEQRSPFRLEFYGERIRQSERDELDEAWFISVGQIAVFVPAEESALDVLLRKRL
jgi:hypothetical protein